MPETCFGRGDQVPKTMCEVTRGRERRRRWTRAEVNQGSCLQCWVEKRLQVLYCTHAHRIKLETRDVSWAVAWDQELRSLALTLTIGTGGEFLLLEIRMTTLSATFLRTSRETPYPNAWSGKNDFWEADIVLQHFSLTIWACSPHNASEREGPQYPFPFIPYHSRFSVFINWTLAFNVLRLWIWIVHPWDQMSLVNL